MGRLAWPLPRPVGAYEWARRRQRLRNHPPGLQLGVQQGAVVQEAGQPGRHCRQRLYHRQLCCCGRAWLQERAPSRLRSWPVGRAACGGCDQGQHAVHGQRAIGSSVLPASITVLPMLLFPSQSITPPFLQASEIAEAGFTAVWFPPASDSVSPQVGTRPAPTACHASGRPCTQRAVLCPAGLLCKAADPPTSRPSCQYERHCW